MTKREQTRLDKLELMKLRECIEMTELKSKDYKEKLIREKAVKLKKYLKNYY